MFHLGLNFRPLLFLQPEEALQHKASRDSLLQRPFLSALTVLPLPLQTTAAHALDLSSELIRACTIVQTAAAFLLQTDN